MSETYPERDDNATTAPLTDQPPDCRARKMALVEEASTLAHSIRWQKTGDRFHQLRVELHTIGPCGEEIDRPIIEAFESYAEWFYQRRRAEMRERTIRFEQNYRQKRAYCLEAEHWSKHPSIAKAKPEIARLRLDWSRVGPTDPHHETKLNNRFFVAIHHYYGRRD